MIKEGRISVYKDDGPTNVADVGTKYLAGPKLAELLGYLQFSMVSGDSSLALKAQM